LESMACWRFAKVVIVVMVLVFVLELLLLSIVPMTAFASMDCCGGCLFDVVYRWKRIYQATWTSRRCSLINATTNEKRNYCLGVSGEAKWQEPTNDETKNRSMKRWISAAANGNHITLFCTPLLWLENQLQGCREVLSLNYEGVEKSWVSTIVKWEDMQLFPYWPLIQFVLLSRFRRRTMQTKKQITSLVRLCRASTFSTAEVSLLYKIIVPTLVRRPPPGGCVDSYVC